MIEGWQAYERALKQERNDAFSLAGLAQACFKAGNREKATEGTWKQPPLTRVK